MGHIETFFTKSGAAKPEAAKLSRRDVLVAALTAAGGLAIGVSLPGISGAAPLGGAPWDDAPAPAGEVNAWIVIEPDDSVIIRVAKAEMGEGVMTSMPMIVAEELACDWTKVRSEYASVNRNIREQTVYKSMLTGGSSAVRASRPYLQQAGASARARLVQAAATRWGVPAADCVAANSVVTHQASGRTLGYGALAGEAAKVTLAQEPAIKTPEQFTLIGKPTARLDTKVKVTGEAIFGIDVRLPDMLYAAVVTCPVPGGTVKSYDAKTILSHRGVQGVVPLPTGLAVVADRFWRAKQAALALTVEWDFGAGAGTDSAQFRQAYRDALKGPLENAKTVGDTDKALGDGKVIEALYEVPYLAHATMEPLNCTVQLQPDRLDIWMGTQAPDVTINLAAKAVGLKPEQVYIHNCYLGGGFGRRAINDEMMQAVAVAKTVSKPVKLVWTREEDMRRDRYRPQAAIAFKAVLGKDGMPSAILAQTAVGSIMQSIKPMLDFPSGKGVEPMAVEGLVNMPYAIPNLKVDAVLKNTHVPVMFWRSVGSSQNAFALESFIDELAHEAGQDPYQFRRKMLADKPDYLRVLDMVAEKSNWGQKMPAGKGRGIAIHEAFGTIVGEVVEVAVDSKGVARCERVVAAVDCGHVINPRNVEMQIESGVIYGLTAALYNEITVKDGQIEQGNFDSYQMVRLADAPKIETYLALSGGTKWGGIGEPGTPPIAPALCNAIFAATGKRVRELPIRKTNLGSSA
jgi:isoquinoline 1-oxidoreductase beta subunit